MKIAQSIAQNIVRNAQERLAKLEALNAPAPIIEGTKRAIEDPLKGISGIKNFGDLEIIGEPTITTGRGGKRIVFFDTAEGRMCYCKGKYGMSLFKSNK